MMNKIFGLFPCCAEAGMLAVIMTANEATRAIQIFLAILMVHFLVIGCPKQGRRPTPKFNHAEVRREGMNGFDVPRIRMRRAMHIRQKPTKTLGAEL
jgi:hypothetical protein